MKLKLPKLRVLFAITTLFFSLQAYSQLPAFNFSVAATNQTCLNNGVLSFTVSGLQPDATVTFAVYLLPNTTTAVITTTNTNVPGLGAGNYSITATQSLNGQTSTNTQTATINNLIVPLTYTLGFTKVRCGNDGTITATVTSGTASTYEITAGPVTKPQQASNVFTALPAGLYSVRVYDNCGEAEVISITVTAATTGITIGDTELSGGELPGCNLINVINAVYTLSPNEIFYPITCQYTVFPPGGGTPTVVSVIVPNGSAFEDIMATIPFYHNQQYSYNLRITDACGNVFNKNNNLVNTKLTLEVMNLEEGCGDNYFVLQVNNYVGPYTITFTQFPVGFNPAALNINHPVFDADGVQYGGDGAYVPEGDYTVQLLDACNRLETLSFSIDDIEKTPQISGDDSICGSNGSIIIRFDVMDVVTAIMTSAPPGYPGPFPLDVSGFINNDGDLILLNMPPGEYSFIITDSCGDEHETDAEVLIVTNPGTLSAGHRPGCQPGFGSVRVGFTEALTNITITAAPTAFPFPLPYIATALIDPADGRLYMNDLPAGSYTFQTLNSCNMVVTLTLALPGYTKTINEISHIPHCGSFDVDLKHTSNGNYVQGFYLQKYNAVDDVWEHPATGVDYVEGAQANATNSIVLTNNSVNLSFAYTGDFRVVKTFFVYDMGTMANIRCVETLHTFTFGSGPVITDAYSFPCLTGLTEVAVIAEGVPPLTYGITTKDGLPFDIDNGQSNLFTGLESAIYNFRVTDVCGNIRNIQLDIDELAALGIKAEGFCEGEASKLFVPEFTFLDYKWYKAGAPNTVLSTTGTLDFPAYDSVAESGTYIVVITSDNPLSCMNQELSFTLDINNLPDAGEDVTAQLCNDGVAVNLTDFLAEGINTNGDWEDMDATGFLTNSTLATAALPEGTYQFRYTLAGLCAQFDDAVITLQVRDKPQVPLITANSPLCEGSDLQFSVAPIAGATYQWTGPNGFTSTDASPLLEDVEVNAAGTYSLAITVNECTSDAGTFAITINAAPGAGDDAQVPLCNEGDVLTLTDYLSGSFDTGGVWEDVNATGALNGNAFTTAGIAEGTYEFRYIVTNICNDTDDAIVAIQLTDIPQAPSITAVAPVCEGADVQLSADTVANAAYLWTGPGGFTSIDQSPLISSAAITANGNYSLTVTVNGCTSAAAVVPVTVNALPQFTVAGNTVLCEGQTSVLTVVPGNFDGDLADYVWYLDGNELGETSGTLEIAELGMYEVAVSNNNCTASTEIEAVLNSNPFELLLDSGCINYDYMLWVANISDIAGATVTWTGPDNFSFTGPEAAITNLQEGEYTATVTNNEGCTATATLDIDNTSCIIPRGISPNDDGFNDSFDLSNLDVIELKIFNRYGLKVYEARNYLKEWHGQSDKGTLPTGTYYYAITLSAGKQITGWVYLQREAK